MKKGRKGFTMLIPLFILATDCIESLGTEPQPVRELRLLPWIRLVIVLADLPVV